MNYLAHFQLATLVSQRYQLPLGAQLSGALLADHLTGWLSTLRNQATHIDRQDGFWEAVDLHRHVDTLTDTHPAMQTLKSLFPDPYRRYAPVLIDIFYDAVLAASFETLCIPGQSVSLPDFANQTYREIAADYQAFPENWSTSARDAFSHMRSHNWLIRYATLRGIEKTLAGISQRLRRPLALAAAIPIYNQHRETFVASFTQVWPDVQRQTLAFCAQHYPLSSLPRLGSPSVDDSSL